MAERSKRTAKVLRNFIISWDDVGAVQLMSFNYDSSG